MTTRPHKSIMQAVKKPLDLERMRIARTVRAIQSELDEFEDQYPIEREAR